MNKIFTIEEIVRFSLMTIEEIDLEIGKCDESTKLFNETPEWAKGMKDPEGLMDMAKKSGLKWVSDRKVTLEEIKQAKLKVEQEKKEDFVKSHS